MGIRTKIVATLGKERPIHGPDDQLRKVPVAFDEMVPWFVEAGVDVFRLNMSHRSPSGTQELQFLYVYRNKRHIWESQGRHVAILGDLQGPKIRTGNFFNDPDATAELESCKEFILHTKKAVPGSEKQVTVFYEDKPFSELAKHVKNGDQIWLGDGEGLLEVRKISRDGTITCHIRSGGKIAGRRGVTVQGVSFNLPSFTAKDKDDLRLLLSFGDELTYVALSFVNTAENILEAKCFIQEWYRNQGLTQDAIAVKMPGLIAKIETQEAVDNIDEILDAADGIMVARGDLGMQIGLEKVAGIQKRIIDKCNVRGKPVITATQMLDSMERNPVPTRAEVTDVYNAILDGTDAIMLSGETSKGPYAIQAIRKMREIAEEAEKDFFNPDLIDLETHFLGLLKDAERILPKVQARVQEKLKQRSGLRQQARCYKEEYARIKQLLQTQQTTDRVSHAACNLSAGVAATAIIAPTTSGQTTRMVARFRPKVHVVGAAHDYCVARKLTLCFGVHPVDIMREYRGRPYQSNEEVFEVACESAKKLIQQPLPSELVQGQEQGQPLINKGELVVITAGFPLFRPGTANLVKLHTVDC